MITNAAKLLYVSQPSVCKVLSHAELQLGFRLYKQMNTINDAAENIRKNDLGQIPLALTPVLGFDLVLASVAELTEPLTFPIKALYPENKPLSILTTNYLDFFKVKIQTLKL